jgi:UrcA family protein
MRSVVRNVGAAAPWIKSRLRPAVAMLGLLGLCALAPAALLTGKGEHDALPAMRSARVSLAGLDLSTPEGARDARERIGKAARALCAGNLGKRPLDGCVSDVLAAAERQIRARTLAVSLADLDLSTPQGVRAARDRIEAAARRVREPQPGSEVPSTRIGACVDETFAHAARQAELLQRISIDF